MNLHKQIYVNTGIGSTKIKTDICFSVVYIETYNIKSISLLIYISISLCYITLIVVMLRNKKAVGGRNKKLAK